MAQYANSVVTAAAESSGDEAILKASRDGLKECIEAEHEQRQLMADDLRFATLDQWPADVRSERENDLVNGRRPCLTVDQINQYRTQVVNDMAANRPSIKTRPVDDAADPQTADVMQGLIRHIEDQSSAHIAYGTAGDSAATIGLGFFRVVSAYVAPDSFDQELLIKRVPDTFSVYLSAHQMPDGSDADQGWVFEKIALETFKRDYPDASVDDADFSGLAMLPTWKTDDSVIVCEYFYKHYESAPLLYLEDGRALWKDDYEKLAQPRPQITDTRESQKVSIKWCKHTGCEILEKRDLPGRYIPIIEEVGKENIVDGKRVLWGLVRPAKDSLRAFNYWISALTEKMALSPKSPFVAAEGQIEGHEQEWNAANRNNVAVLQYKPVDVNGNAVPPPRRQEAMQMEPAMVQMLTIMQNNVKSSLGMYKAAIGDTESQQSGRAILALKRESDTGTAHFGMNQSISVTHCGRILVDLIPYYYDTKRVLRILGEDGKPQSVAVDPGLQDANGQPVAKQEFKDAFGKVKRIYNLGVGKYDVTVTTGPGYTTSRQEAATIMTDLANSAKDPVSAAIMRYGAVKNSDFHGSDEIMKMLKAMLPPQIQPPDEGQEPLPPQAMQKIAQLTQVAQGMQQKLQEVGQENVQLKSGAQVDMAKVSADHDAKMKAIALDEAVAKERARVERERFEFEKALETDRAKLAIELDERKAIAAHKLKAMELDFEHDCRQKDEAHQAAEAQKTEQLKTSQQVTEKNLSRSLTAMNESLAAILKALQNPAPRQMSIGALRKGPDGRVIGASVNAKAQTLQ